MILGHLANQTANFGVEASSELNQDEEMILSLSPSEKLPIGSGTYLTTGIVFGGGYRDQAILDR